MLLFSQLKFKICYTKKKDLFFWFHSVAGLKHKDTHTSTRIDTQQKHTHTPTDLFPINF